MKLKLKVRATLLVVAIVSLLLVVISVLQRRQLAQDFGAMIQQQQDALTGTVAEELGDKLEVRVAVLERATRGVELSPGQGSVASREVMARLAAARPLFDRVFLFGTDGVMRGSEPAGGQANVIDRAYFRQVLATGLPVISEPLLSRSDIGLIVIVVAVPVRDASERVSAVALGTLTLDSPTMLGQLAHAKLGQGGHFEIVTRGPNPVYVAHPDPARLLTAASAAESAERAAHGDVISRTPVRGVDWELRAVLPADEAQAPMARARQRGEALAAGMALGTALFVWLGMSMLLKPLSVLHETIQRLRDDPGGDHRIDTRGGDERGDLARAFEALVHDLHERQAELTAVTEASPIGMFRTNTAGLTTYANDAYLRLLGLNRSNVSVGWLGMLPVESRDAVWRAWQAAASGTSTLNLVRRLKRADGSLVLVMVRTGPLMIDGRVQGQVGTMMDITEQAAAEKSTRLLNAILDSTTDYVAQSDTRGLIVYMNPAMRRAVGLAPDDPLDDLRFPSFNSDAAEQRFQMLEKPAADQFGVWLGESSLCTVAGETPISKLLIAHRDKSGKVDRYSAIMRNITAELQAQRTLQLQASTLHSVTESIPAIVAVLGSDRRYRFANGAFERWVRKRREDLIGRSMSEAYGEAEYERRRPWVDRVLEGEPVHFELTYGPPGPSQVLALNFIPLRLDDGAIDGFVSVAQDITQHRENEDRLRVLAHQDSLTGLLNRAGFEQVLERCLREGNGPAMALLYIDLDHFKPVNDTHGHPIGDEVLCQFATRIQGLVRPSDAVARLGGDEFAIVLIGVREIANAEMVADKVIVVAQTPFEIGPLRIVIGASVGVAFGIVEDGAWQDLVARADGMLYRAKQGGRGRSAVALH